MNINGTQLVWAITAMFIALVAGSVALAVGLPESANPGGLIAQLLAAFAVLVASLGGMFGVAKARQEVQAVATDVATVVEQTNGKHDARLQRMATAAAIAAVENHIKRPDNLS